MTDRLQMIRDHLRDLPDAALPAAFHLRPYRPGDDRTWYDIHLKADRYTKLTSQRFVDEFGSDDELLAARQLYLCDSQNGEPLGTATAWQDDDGAGRVHWVAIVPEAQGRGLAKPLLAAVCQRLAELGHQQTRLTTQSPRIAAVNLYLRFGFRPDLRSAEDVSIWQRLRAQLKPEFHATIDQAIAAFGAASR
ncbi:MAG: GNAT family N-acetyltransferase [Phycisphaeraceae bacterium]